MTLRQQLDAGVPGIIAILRGVLPDEVVDVAQTLIDAGIRIIEVPLNSPQPLQSIERLCAAVLDDVMIGAGTVTSVAAVDAVVAAGGRLIVAPNADAAVIARSIERQMDIIPGVLTPTECFTAVNAGARHLKLFPASSLGIAHLQALREVLPRECCMWAVGGVGSSNLAEWRRAGVAGIGVGSSLYRAGSDLKTVQARATELVQAWRASQVG